MQDQVTVGRCRRCGVAFVDDCLCSEDSTRMLKPTDDVLPGHIFLGELFDIFEAGKVPAEYAAGLVVVAGGEWRREDGNRWRFWGRVHEVEG